MRAALRWAGYVAGGLLLLVLLAAAYIWFASNQKLNARVAALPEKLVQPTAAQLANGSRQLRILGCLSCHGEGLRGRTMFADSKIAVVNAPNLTLIAAKASDQQLAQAIRQGIGHDGRPLFVMPSAEYSRLTDAEVAALIAAIRALPKGGAETPPIKVGPLGRIGVVNGRFRTQPELVEHYRQNEPADLGPQLARGRHIAMTTCSECHGPAFGGGQAGPGVDAPDLSIVGSYDLPAFVQLMRTGIPADKRKMKLMDEVARDNFSRMTDEELAALHAYLVERAQRAP